MPRRIASRALEALPWFAIVAGMSGVLLTCTLRDSVPYVAALYYALPMPVIALAALVGGTTALLRERLVAAALCATLLIVSVAVQRSTAFVHSDTPTDATAESISGLLWNVRRGRDGARAVMETVRRHDPDLVMLVEPLGVASDGAAPDVPKLFRGYDVCVVGTRFVVAVRGRIDRVGPLEHRADARVAVVDVTIDGRRLSVVCVDVQSNPLTPRGPSVAAVAKLAAPYADGPALVLGDFNTPRGSVHFDALRARWSHVFEAAGNGPDVTWPEPLPVLSLDHVWTSAALRCVACRIDPTRVSDHRPVIFEIETR